MTDCLLVSLIAIAWKRIVLAVDPVRRDQMLDDGMSKFSERIIMVGKVSTV